VCGQVWGVLACLQATVVGAKSGGHIVSLLIPYLQHFLQNTYKLVSF